MTRRTTWLHDNISKVKPLLVSNRTSCDHCAYMYVPHIKSVQTNIPSDARLNIPNNIVGLLRPVIPTNPVPNTPRYCKIRETWNPLNPLFVKSIFLLVDLAEGIGVTANFFFVLFVFSASTLNLRSCRHTLFVVYCRGVSKLLIV